MITFQDQDQLFRLIATRLQRDVHCYAFGGNAMMFYGYKDETKDVDLLFENHENLPKADFQDAEKRKLFVHHGEREEFIRVIQLLGFEKWSPGGIYVPEKLRVANAPLVFKGDNGRFDLFLEKIFQTLLSPQMKEDKFAVHEYRGQHTLTMNVLRKEHLVMLKAVTERENDFRDIRTIIEKDKHFDWQYFIDEVVWQFQHGDGWVVLDVEKMMKELQKYVFIEEKYVKQLYAVQGKE